jgi:hypothetical protein
MTHFAGYQSYHMLPLEVSNVVSCCLFLPLGGREGLVQRKDQEGAVGEAGRDEEPPNEETGLF